MRGKARDGALARDVQQHEGPRIRDGAGNRQKVGPSQATLLLEDCLKEAARGSARISDDRSPASPHNLEAAAREGPGQLGRVQRI